VSKDEQKRRFLARLDNPDKQWKLSAADVAERAHWDRYMAAYDEAITATSTPWAPWHVIPADHKWLTQALVAAILVDSIRSLDLQPAVRMTVDSPAGHAAPAMHRPQDGDATIERAAGAGVR
jgi:Polyphosphate kinase 2 (PPK2)